MKKILLTAVIVYLLFCLTCAFANHFDLYGRAKPSFFLAGWPFLKDLFRIAWEGNDFTVVPVIALLLICFGGISIFVYKGVKHFLVIALLFCSMVSYGQTSTETIITRIVGGGADTFQISPSIQARVQVLENRLNSLINTLRTQQWLGSNPHDPWQPLIWDSAALRRACEVGIDSTSGFTLSCIIDSVNNENDWVRDSPLQADTIQVCRNVSSSKRGNGYPYPAILYMVVKKEWDNAVITYLDSKKHPLKPWIRVWENN